MFLFYTQKLRLENGRGGKYQVCVEMEGFGEVSTAIVVHRSAVHQEIPHTALGNRHTVVFVCFMQ